MRRLVISILGLWTGTPAVACDCRTFSPAVPHFARDVSRVVQGATVIVEAIIVEPMGAMLEPALVRPIRLLKGARQPSYRVGFVSNCSLLLREPEIRTGQSMLLVLYGGPDLFEASRCVNLQAVDFNREVMRQSGASCDGR